ncbi:hypothetical protein PVOR_24034 [Paenibacillus vortex V453]|uniref:Uncharacterized protein n=1 Tax=Paenibacillus vortex V453 TaxID=715225 RepID=A0A2R9SQ01_9BACL|nr:hypothetical protein PVOR_24034 [Paenibacillus vortex V453]
MKMIIIIMTVKGPKVTILISGAESEYIFSKIDDLQTQIIIRKGYFNDGKP